MIPLDAQRQETSNIQRIFDHFISRRKFIQFAGKSAALPIAISPLAATLSGCDSASSNNSDDSSEIDTNEIPPASAEYITLKRTSFGVERAAMADIQSLGIDAFLEAQLNYETLDDGDLETTIETLFPLTTQTAEQLLGGFPDNIAAVAVQMVSTTQFRQFYSKRQLYEVMVEFWSDHFNIQLVNGLGPTLKPVDDINATANSALQAVAELQAAGLPDITPDNGAIYPSSNLSNKLQQASQLIKSSLPCEVICMDSDGWDHHENLPVYLNQSLAELAEGVAAFYQDMGDRMARISVLIYTEFGRRVSENGSNGVDHGTGGLAYLIGGGVNGGQVFSDWPGLDIANLALNEDLAITTDLRSVMSELLDKRMGGTHVNSVFPGYTGTIDNALFNRYS